jgi:hypothetical protein
LEKVPTAAPVGFEAAIKMMEFNMVGKAVMRAFIIFALIVTAHAIKPFSIKSVTQHLLYSTRSFKFILPDRLQDNFDHANYLAINLSNSLFEVGEGIQNLTGDAASDFGLVAIKAQPLDEVNKSATKQKTCPKKSAPTKRVVKSDRNGGVELIAGMNSDEILPVELPPAPEIAATPVIAPVVQLCATKLFPARLIAISQPSPIELLIALRRSDCEKRTAPKGVLITVIEEATEERATFQGAEKSKVNKIAKAGRIGLLASECEERRTEVVAEELEIEVVAPEEEIIAPQTNEEFKLNLLSDPFEKRSKEP